MFASIDCGVNNQVRVLGVEKRLQKQHWCSEAISMKQINIHASQHNWHLSRFGYRLQPGEFLHIRIWVWGLVSGEGESM